MPPERPQDLGPRARSDRRRRPTTPWDAFKGRTQRVRPRRVEERREDHFTDRFEPTMFLLVVLLLMLTLADGGMTLILLGIGCEEANPAMRYLLQLGPTYFILGKYALTSAGLPFLLVYRKFSVFHSSFRVGHLVPLFVGLYIILLAYQVALIGQGLRQNRAPDPPTGDKPAAASYGPPGVVPGIKDFRSQISDQVQSAN